MAMAQTAVLGDSQGSVAFQHPPTADSELTSPLPAQDLAPDGGVTSGLGDSYIDGAEAKNVKLPTYDEEEEEALEDGGVLGLLAQIYETKGQGPARVI
jgi:autophagy-related protein 9